MSPVNTDTSFIENRAPNVAAQFRERVHAEPGPGWPTATPWPTASRGRR